MSRSASWNAITELAQAATWVMTGPVRPYSIDSMQAAMEPDSAGIANGLTCPGPLRRDVRAVDDLLEAAAAGVHHDGHAIPLLRVDIAAKSMPESRDRLLARSHRQAG